MCAGPHLVVGGETVAQADARRFFAGHFAAGVQQVLGALRPDDRRQCHGDPETLMQPEPAEVGHETGGLTGHPKVGDQRQTEAAAHRRTLHGGDDRRVGGEQARRLVIQRTGGTLHRRLASAERARQVRARTEMPARRAQHDGPRIGVGVEAFEGIGQPGDQGRIEMVAGTALELDGGDVVVGDLDADLMTHQAARADQVKLCISGMREVRIAATWRPI